MVDISLWQQSGHADKFASGMFTLDADDRQFAVKPMNCPCHVQVFNQGLKSYRDLPQRLAEFGSCHRNEPSGSLHGIMRVRGFTQDDAHIFCTEEQIQSEVAAFIDMLHEVYADFALPRSSTGYRPALRNGSAPNLTGIGRKPRWAKPWTQRTSTGKFCPEREPSTDRR